MDIKKSEKASLENKKLLFVEIGLVVSLAIVLAAFEWTSTETETSLLEDTTEVLIEEEIISTQMETPPPPPEAPKEPVVSDFIDIVDDDVILDCDTDALKQGRIDGFIGKENPYTTGDICLGTCFFVGNRRVCRKSALCRVFQCRKRSSFP